jgi:TetR/AcrR family transcriptional regulator, repressor for uid operon
MAMPAEPLPSDVSADPLGERLLAAAVEVFAERGYDRAGVAEIARRAGVTTGAIYSRYAGKAELLAAALEAHATDDLDALFADHQFAGRAEDVLTIAGRHLVDAPTDDKGRGTTLLAEAFVAARRDPKVASLLRGDVLERQQKLRDIIEAAKASGGISPALDTEALVTFCHALGFGFVMLGAVEVPMPDAEPWEQLIAHLVAALADPPAPIDLTDIPDPLQRSTAP